MKSVLYVTTRLFWPADSGRKVSLYHYCKGMRDQLGYDVHIFSFLEGDQSLGMASAKPDFISSVTIASEVSLAEKCMNIAKALLDNSMPLQCCLFMSRKNRDALRRLTEKINPDFIIFDMVRLAPYIEVLRDFGIPMVINFDDLLSKRYNRQLEITGGNVLGKYGEKASGVMGKLANGPFKKAILGSEAKRVAQAEDKFGDLADACLFVSPIEAGEFDARVGERKCFAATMGAETIGSIAPNTEKVYDFGFVGNMHTSANQDSLRYLVDEVLSLLPDATLRVIGVCPEVVESQYASNGNVSFTGCVDSVANSLGQCSIMLAPFAYGTGIKTKVLEAMALGIPVVTNSIGLEGIAVSIGEGVLCADTPEGLAEEALSLLKNDVLRVQIAEAGRKYIQCNHTWEKSIASIGECLTFASLHAAGHVKKPSRQVQNG